MKLDTKGMTLVELIISVALLSVVLGFLFKVLLDVKYESDDAGFAIINQVNRAEIIKTIQYDFEDLGLINVTARGNTIELEFNEETKSLSITDKSLSYADKKWTIKDENYKFGDAVVNVVTTDYWKITIPVVDLTGANESSVDDIVLFTRYKKIKEAIYFKDVILAHANENNYLYSTIPNFNKTTTKGEYGLYTAADNYGLSYYFRGDVKNNYVQFGTYAEDTTSTIYDYTNWKNKQINIEAGTPMYWRIVRINGDGSVRLIYDGVEKVENGVAHTATIKLTRYNPYESHGDAKYVGYSYDVGGTQKGSTVKGVVDAWYDKHLETNYGKYIADSIFCNDKVVAETSSNGNINYVSHNRLRTNNLPVLTCANTDDRYTINREIGNGYLSNPVGLLTADEAVMAGGKTTKMEDEYVMYSQNKTYYLFSSDSFWTLTSHTNRNMWVVNYHGSIDSYTLTYPDPGARPVINLKANVKVNGTGTINDPYVLK